MGVLTKADKHALARYCELFAEYRKVKDFIDENGRGYPVKKWNPNMASVNKNGEPVDGGYEVVDYKIFPEVKMFLALADRLLRLEQEFGLTPSARVRLEADQSANQHGQGSGNDKRSLLRVG
jgi:P27 family predicted phage terminase small subunit